MIISVNFIKVIPSGLFKLIDSVKEAFKMVEDRRGFSREPVASAATFNDQHYVQTVVDAVRRSSKTHEWVKVRVASEEELGHGAIRTPQGKNRNNLY